MRHAAGAICRPNCMQFAYTLSLPYKKCDYIFSSHLVSYRIVLSGVIPQLTKCAMGNAQVLFALPLPLLLLVLLPLLTFFISENKQQNLYVYSVFGSHSLPISFSLDPHSGCGDRQRKFFSISLSPRLASSLSLFFSPSFSLRLVHFSLPFWFIYDAPSGHTLAPLFIP